MADRESPRYPKRHIAPGPRTSVDGQSLGRMMLPSDIFIAFKRIADLDDDEILDAFARGVARLATLPSDAAPGERMGLDLDEIDAAIEAGAAVTRSRLVAWRKRHRQMTWPELRVLLRGLTWSAVDPDKGGRFNPRG